jgi:hypothetical protein
MHCDGLLPQLKLTTRNIALSHIRETHVLAGTLANKFSVLSICQCGRMMDHRLHLPLTGMVILMSL